VAVVQYTYTHKQHRKRPKTNSTKDTKIHRTTQKIHRATQQLERVILAITYSYFTRFQFFHVFRKIFIFCPV